MQRKEDKENNSNNPMQRKSGQDEMQLYFDDVERFYSKIHELYGHEETRKEKTPNLEELLAESSILKNCEESDEDEESSPSYSPWMGLSSEQQPSQRYAYEYLFENDTQDASSSNEPVVQAMIPENIESDVNQGETVTLRKSHRLAIQNVTAAPTSQNVTAAPTSQNVTAAPTSQNVTAAPTSQNVTAAPTSQNVTMRKSERLQFKIPEPVNPNYFPKYEDCLSDTFLDLPAIVPEVVRRRIPVGRFPGPVMVGGREEFYVECIYKKVFDQRNDEWYIVIWAGWPAEYATIEPYNNMGDTVAMDLFEAATKGLMVGSGSSNFMYTAVRTIKKNLQHFGKNETTPENKLPRFSTNELDKIFDSRIRSGIYRKRIGFVSGQQDRMQLFMMEWDLWSEVYALLCSRKCSQFHVFEALHGNYFGRGKKSVSVSSSKLQDSWSVITKSISAKMNATEWKEETKHCVLVCASQVGDFSVDMNKVTTVGERFMTHFGVLVVRQRMVDSEKSREYFWFEPTLHTATMPYKPMSFLYKGKFGKNNVVNLIFGDELDSHDCVYKCMSWVYHLVQGNVSLDEGPYRQYDFNKRPGHQ